MCETICIIITYIHTYSLKKVYQNRFIWFYLDASLVYMYVCTHILNSNNSSQLQSNRIVQQKVMFVSFFLFCFSTTRKNYPLVVVIFVVVTAAVVFGCFFWHYPLTIWTHRPTSPELLLVVNSRSALIGFFCFLLFFFKQDLVELCLSCLCLASFTTGFTLWF